MMLMQRKTKHFLASAAPVAMIPAAILCLAAPAYADTNITGTTSTPLATSTSGNITLASTGVVNISNTTSPVAITVDSSNSVTVNTSATVTAGTGSGAIGILVNPGVSSTITNAGTINVLETYTPAEDASGVAQTSPALASGRYGIWITGTTPVTSSVNNTGVINVDGNYSAGIEVDPVLNGTFNTEATIYVKGDDSVGVKTAGVNGAMTVGGAITAVGQGSQALVVNGEVTGQLLIDGSLTQAYSFTTGTGTTETLGRAALTTGAAAVQISKSVDGGVWVYAPLSSTSTDTNRGQIVSYGTSPALLIGGTSNITIGTNVGGTDAEGTTSNVIPSSLAIDGSVTATAYYSSTNAIAVEIGGQGGTVSMPSGIAVTGTVTATTVDSATTAILINSGATVPSLYNSGTIKAVISEPGFANAYAIRDLSGTLTSVTNQGYITVAGSTATNVTNAIDLSANTTGTTITQSLNATDTADQATDKATTGYNPDTATVYVGMTGDIYTGTGSSKIDIESGTVVGNAYYGGGTNTLIEADDAKWTGNINLESGSLAMTMGGNSRFTGTMNLNDLTGSITLNDSARWLGSITGGAQTSVAINSGTFGANAIGTTTIKSLTVGSSGVLRVYIDGSSHSSSTLAVTGTAAITSGATVQASIGSLATAAGTYTVLTAGTLTGGSYLTSSSLNLPALFDGSVTTTGNIVQVTISQATAAQLGLTAAQTSAYQSILNNAAANSYIQQTLLQIYDQPTLRGRFNELLPDYSGGPFDMISRGARLAARHIDDDSTMFSISNSTAWLEPVIYHGIRKYGETAGYTDGGGGLAMGIEKVTDLGNVGLTLDWLTGNVKTGTYQTVKGNDFELGAFWRHSSGPLYIWARGALGRSSFKSTRTFFGSYSTVTATGTAYDNFTYNAAGHWAGWSGSTTAGVSYALPVGDHFSLRPRGVLEYFRLHENGYIENGDTPIALTVQGRNSTALTATTTLVAAWSTGPSSHEGRPFSVELEAGRRSNLTGNLGDTTATYETGDTFTINGGKSPSSIVGQVSILQGGLDYTWKVGTDIERPTGGGIAYGIRASISVAL